SISQLPGYCHGLMSLPNLLQSNNEILISFNRCRNHIVSYCVVRDVDLLQQQAANLFDALASAVVTRRGRLLNSCDQLCTDLDILLGRFLPQLLNDTDTVSREVCFEGLQESHA